MDPLKPSPAPATEIEYRDGKDQEYVEYDRPFGGETGRLETKAKGSNDTTTQGERGNKNADENDYRAQRGYGQNQHYGQVKPDPNITGPGQQKPGEK